MKWSARIPAASFQGASRTIADSGIAPSAVPDQSVTRLDYPVPIDPFPAAMVRSRLCVNVLAGATPEAAIAILKNGFPIGPAVVYTAGDTGVKCVAFNLPFNAGDVFALAVGQSPNDPGFDMTATALFSIS